MNKRQRKKLAGRGWISDQALLRLAMSSEFTIPSWIVMNESHYNLLNQVVTDHETAVMYKKAIRAARVKP